MRCMDTTSTVNDPQADDALAAVSALLDAATRADPAEAVAPMAEIAEILESLLDHGDGN